MREEILSAFIRLVAHTPELQGYTASKLYLALKADISQESLTLAATWILGEYSEVLLQDGIISDDDQSTRVSPQIGFDLRKSNLMLGYRQGYNRSSCFNPRLALRQLSCSPICSCCRHQDFFTQYYIYERAGTYS